MAEDKKPTPFLEDRFGITATTYEAMWEAYRDGSRTATELVTRFGIHPRTAYKAIETGWPSRGFRALKERVQEHDKMRAEAERQAAQDKFKEATDAWYRAGKQFNRVADNAVSFAIAALQQVNNLAMERTQDGKLQLRRLTKWVRRRAVEERDGQRNVRYYDEEVPLPIPDAIKLQKAILQAAQHASVFKRLWPLTSDEERAKDGAPMGLASMDEAQLEHFLKTGQLPEGVDPEEVYGKRATN